MAQQNARSRRTRLALLAAARTLVERDGVPAVTMASVAEHAGVTRRADAVLNRITLVKLDEPVLRLASRVGPRVLRTIDAIHLATALSMGDDPEAFITYDDRLAAAARILRLRVLQPGR